MINNVGDVAREQMSWRDMTEESVDHVLAVDIKGTMACTHEFGSRMLDQGHGAIVNIGSTVIVRGSARAPQYAAAKYGILGLTKSYAHAFAPTVRVNVFAPGFIETAATLAREDWRGGRGDEMRSKTPMGRIPGPEELAGTALFLATDDASHMTGAYMVADGGFNMVGRLMRATSISTSARELVRRAVDKAEQLGISGAIAVVGASGALVTSSRMDEGGAGGLGRARSKAWIAATQKIPSTEHLHRMNTHPPAIAAGFVAVSPEAAFPGAGGMPVRDDAGRIIGAVAASGATVSPFFPAELDRRYSIVDGQPANPEDQVIAYALDVPYVGQHGDDKPRWEARYGAWQDRCRAAASGRSRAASGSARARPCRRARRPGARNRAAGRRRGGGPPRRGGPRGGGG